MFEIETIRNLLNVWDPIVKYISPLSDDLEGNQVVNYPKSQKTTEFFGGCFSILTAVKILITLTFLGLGYAVFSISRATIHYDNP